MASFKNSLLYFGLYLIPKNLVSHLMGFLVSIRLPRSLASVVNRTFARMYRIDVSEASKPFEDYRCLQEFFSRRLRPGLRSIDVDEKSVTSPCDGTLSRAEKIENGCLVQAKSRLYRLEDLVGDKEVAEAFRGGNYATIYLSPRDYHRFHAPVSGEIVNTTYIPGNLWPVNPWAIDNVDNLFCQNERIVSLIKERAYQGQIAFIAIGATMVGKIDLLYGEKINLKQAQARRERVTIFHDPIAIRRGEELGTFLFGSTIILLFQQGMIEKFSREQSTHIKMGEMLARLLER